MSAAAELIRTAREAGADIRLHGERVRVTPRKPLPPDLRDSLRAHKAELLAELKAKDAALLARCREACRGLPVKPETLLEILNDADRQAMLSGDPRELAALRCAAECLGEVHDLMN